MGVRPLRCFLSFDCCRNLGGYYISETTQSVLMDPGFPATLDAQIFTVTVTLYGHLPQTRSIPQAPTYRLYLNRSRDLAAWCLYRCVECSPSLASSSAFALGFPPEGHFTDCFDLWLRFVAVTDFFVVVVAAAATAS